MNSVFPPAEHSTLVTQALLAEENSLAQYARIGNNVNQIARALNSDEEISTAIGMEMQLGSLANLLSKLMGKARTTTNTLYYEVLNAHIVKLQYQMAQRSLSLEVEKARASLDGRQADPKERPKI